MPLGLINGKTIRLFFSDNEEDLKDLNKYTDKFNLRDCLLDFNYVLTPGSNGEYSITIELINPGFEFEKSFLSYYSLLYENGIKKNPITNNYTGLLYFMRWGYGTTEVEGISRIICGALTNIQYEINSPNEKKVILSFVDIFTNSQKGLQTQTNAGQVTSQTVNCLDENNNLKPIGDVVSEVLAGICTGFDGVVPYVNLFSNSQAGNNLNQLYLSLAAKLASGGLETQEALKVIEDSGIKFSNQQDAIGFIKAMPKADQLDINFNEIEPLWDDFKISKTPSRIHRFLAYKLLLEELGLEVAYGLKKESVTVPSVVVKVVDGFANLPTLLNNTLQGFNKTIAKSLDIPISGKVIEKRTVFEFGKTDLIVYDHVASIEDGLVTSQEEGFNASVAIDNGMYKDGKIHFRPSFKSPYWEEFDQLQSGSHPNQALFFFQTIRYFSNSSKTYFIELNNETRRKLQDMYMSYTGQHKEVMKDVESNNRNLFDYIFDETEENIVEKINGIYVETTLTKPTNQSLKTTVTSFIEDLNTLLSPFNKAEDDMIASIVVPYASLYNKQKETLSNSIGSLTTSSTILVLGPKKTIKSIFNTLDYNVQYPIYSFKDLQNNEILNLQYGFDDKTNIINSFSFTENILPAKAEKATIYNALESVRQLFNDNGVAKSFSQVTEQFLNTLKFAGLNNNTSPTVNKLFKFGVQTESQEQDYAEFVNSIQDFYAEVKQNNYGTPLKIVIESDFVQAYINTIQSTVFNDLFVDTKNRDIYAITKVNGSAKIGKKSIYSSYVVKQSIINSLFDDQILKKMYNMYMARYSSFLYKMPFKLSLTTVGIPELSNPIVDIGSLGNRVVSLKIRELRVPGKQEHWLSGKYHIVGYEHSISSAGYETRLHLYRVPMYNEISIFK